MRRHRAHIVLAAAIAGLSASALRAQTPEPAVFRRGQWGADFTIGNGFIGAGLIRFRTPTRATVLDVTANVSTFSSAGQGASPGVNSAQVGLSLGTRRYRSLASRVFLLHTLGIEGSYAHEFAGGAAPVSQTTWGVGVFGEPGATWLVTPHLAVGAAVRVSADYLRSTITGGRALTTWTFGIGRLHLTGQLYF